ncbi:FAD/NAD(P)-binding domain-containing protein [Corynespora cassiicola Philippines]|uniref:FAD/NAD(P)-binding domain-containing protein n=1 Tax=Corynespora cassiicola Philippines TaxID=1448308 RepID=A0A2T2NBX8_CORCC|nr:FAD/NAD(P)-binding domain-containing protein [Corynespora cassiicola Philippines]
MAVSEEILNGTTNSSANGTIEEVDLVIIGAGPTGLLSGLLARQLGLKICILDAKEGPLQVGGADAITARTQQYLEVASNFPYDRASRQDAGILPELINRGVKCNTSTTYADGTFTSRQSHWWNSLSHTFYNNLLMIGQPFIERHFASYLDVPVHYAEPALSFSHILNDDGTPQSVTVKTAKRTVKAKFCLASDGAKSFVRNELDIAFEGTKPNMVWAVLDCWIDSTFPVTREIVTLQVDGESRMAWIPRERGMQRFYILLDGEITQAKAEASIRRHMAPHPVEFTHVEWFSKFEIKERLASTFLHPTPLGPYILAGDSAHVHSVNGGQGMNTGLSDAFALIWRLALLTRHPHLPSATQTALLRSYDTERRATAKEVIDVAAKLVRSTTAEAKGYVELIEKNAGFITGMGVKYWGVGSECVVEGGKRGVFGAGGRCPDLWVQGPEAQRLYQMFRYGRYVLVTVGEEVGEGKRAQTRNEEVVKVVRLRPLKALGMGVEREVERIDEGDYAEESFGCSYVKKGERYAALVRPDCYVETVGEIEDVVEYLERRIPGTVGFEKTTNEV